MSDKTFDKTPWEVARDRSAVALGALAAKKAAEMAEWQAVTIFDQFFGQSRAPSITWPERVKAAIDAIDTNPETIAEVRRLCEGSTVGWVLMAAAKLADTKSHKGDPWEQRVGSLLAEMGTLEHKPTIAKMRMELTALGWDADAAQVALIQEMAW